MKNAPQVDLVIRMSPGSARPGARSAKPGRQDLGQRGGLVDLTLRPVKLRHDVDKHDGRPSVAESSRQRLAALDQFVGGDRSEFPAEDPVLQVDQHEGRRSWVEGDHRGAPTRLRRGLRERIYEEYS